MEGRKRYRTGIRCRQRAGP